MLFQQISSTFFNTSKIKFINFHLVLSAVFYSKKSKVTSNTSTQNNNQTIERRSVCSRAFRQFASSSMQAVSLKSGILILLHIVGSKLLSVTCPNGNKRKFVVTSTFHGNALFRWALGAELTNSTNFRKQITFRPGVQSFMSAWEPISWPSKQDASLFCWHIW